MVPHSERTDGPAHAKVIALLAIASLFAYFNSLHGDYVLDDVLITQNPHVRDPFQGGLSTRPVVAMSVAANHLLDGVNPRGYHLLNLAVHGLGALVLYDLIRRVLLLPRFGKRFSRTAGWIGLVAALLWVVHPLTTQAVTYIIQRCESMMGLFFLITLWCFLRGATVPKSSSWWYAGATGAAALGAGCKEVMVVLPAVLVLFDRTFLSGSWGGVLRRWKPILLISTPPLIGAAAFLGLGFLTGSEGTVGFTVGLFTPATYALTQTEVILHYIRLAFWPSGQCLDYLDWPVPTWPNVWPSVAAMSAMVLAALYGVLRNRSWGFLSATFFLILAPTSSFIPVQDPAFEHRMYLPLAVLVTGVAVGGAQILGSLTSRWPAREQLTLRLAGTGIFVVVVALGITTAARNEVYASAMTLYADNAEKRPSNARVRAVYAGMLFRTGEAEEAERELRAALAAPRQLPGNRIALALILYDLGRTEEALEIARETLRAAPEDLAVNSQYGFLLLASGRAAEAVPYLKVVADSEPHQKTARLNLGIALCANRQEVEGEQLLRVLAQDHPEVIEKTVETARHSATDPKTKPHVLAYVVELARAACTMSDSPPVEHLDTLAIALARAGRHKEAIDASEAAIETAIRNGWTQYEIGILRQRDQLYRAGKPYLPESFAPSEAQEAAQ